MIQSKRWRRAMIVSLVIHAVILTGVGWIASHSLPSQEVTEQVVELDLSSEADMPLGDSAAVSSGSDGAASLPSQAAALSASSAAVPHVVTATSSMAVLSAEIPTGVSESGAGSAAGSSEGAGQGQVAGTGSGSGSGNSGSGSGSGSGNGSGSGSGRGSGGYTHPGILSQVTPTYPDSARRQGVQGTVVLKIQILTNGQPGFVTVYRSSGDDSLDAAAVDAVQQWRFIPAQDRNTGEAITCVTTMPVAFRLN